MGYPTSKSVRRVLREQIKHEARLIDGETRATLLELELARLDALQTAQWDAAMDGDVKACAEVRAIIMSRVKVLGLDVPDPQAVGQTVLVVRGNEETYVEALKQASGDLTTP